MHTERNNVANYGLHDETLERDAIVRELLVAVIELEIVVEDQATLHVRGHGNAHGGGARVIGKDHGAVAFVRKVQTVAEEQGTHKRQVLEFAQRDRTLQQLPLLLQRIELVDELARIREKVMIVVLVARGRRDQEKQRKAFSFGQTGFATLPLRLTADCRSCRVPAWAPPSH